MARRALCLSRPALCDLHERPFADYDAAARAGSAGMPLPALYTYGVTGPP